MTNQTIRSKSRGQRKSQRVTSQRVTSQRKSDNTTTDLLKKGTETIGQEQEPHYPHENTLARKFIEQKFHERWLAYEWMCKLLGQETTKTRITLEMLEEKRNEIERFVMIPNFMRAHYLNRLRH